MDGEAVDGYKSAGGEGGEEEGTKRKQLSVGTPTLQAVVRTASQMRSLAASQVRGLSIIGKSVDSASSK
jgi:hypothetical protein